MHKAVFLIDIDNTLLDNDHIKEEIKRSLISVLGEGEALHFWHHHDEFREYKKLVDFPHIIHQYCAEKHKDTCELTLGRIFQNIEFQHALYPKAYEVLSHLKTLGKVVLFTEGDSVYQKMKVDKSGLAERADAVELYEHKLDHLSEIMKKYEGYKVIVIEDRADTLIKIKKQFPEIFAIEVCQGHYATADHKLHKALNMVVNSIGELLSLSNNTILI